MLQFKEENETSETIETIESKATFNPEQAGAFIHATLDNAKVTGHGEQEYQQMLLDYALQKAREEDRPIQEVYREARQQADKRVIAPLSSRAKWWLFALFTFVLCSVLLFVGRGASRIAFGMTLISIAGMVTIFMVGAFYNVVSNRKPR